jgi:hypothetical protein
MVTTRPPDERAAHTGSTWTLPQNTQARYLEYHFLVLELLWQQLQLRGAGQAQDVAHVLVLLVHVGTHGVPLLQEDRQREAVRDHAQVLAAVRLHHDEVADLHGSHVAGPHHVVPYSFLELNLFRNIKRETRSLTWRHVTMVATGLELTW